MSNQFIQAHEGAQRKNRMKTGVSFPSFFFFPPAFVQSVRRPGTGDKFMAITG